MSACEYKHRDQFVHHNFCYCYFLPMHGSRHTMRWHSRTAPKDQPARLHMCARTVEHDNLDWLSFVCICSALLFSPSVYSRLCRRFGVSRDTRHMHNLCSRVCSAAAAAAAATAKYARLGSPKSPASNCAEWCETCHGTDTFGAL